MKKSIEKLIKQSRFVGEKAKEVYIKNISSCEVLSLYQDLFDPRAIKLDFSNIEKEYYYRIEEDSNNILDYLKTNDMSLEVAENYCSDISYVTKTPVSLVKCILRKFYIGEILEGGK